MGILANVLSGAYVFDITKTASGRGQYLDWWSSSRSRYFWALVAVLAVMGLYGWGVARLGVRVRRRLTEEAIRARAVEALLDPLLDQMKSDINTGRLKSLPEALRMLGIEKDGKR